LLPESCELAKRPARYLYLAAAFCFLFGLVLIATTQLAGDGGWFWYTVALLRGSRPYADLKVAIQPFFLLESELLMLVLGKSWLASRVGAVIHLALLVSGMFLVARKSDWPDPQKAVVLLGSFFVLIRFEQYRFDDYHVVTHAACIWSIYLLLRLGRGGGHDFRIAAVLGLLAGIGLMNRVNDGAAVLCAALVVLLCATAANRFISALLFGLCAGAVVWLAVSLTGDRFGDYLAYSLFKAANNKGGAGNVLAYPFALPLNALRYLLQRNQVVTIAFAAAASLAWFRFIRPYFAGAGSVVGAALGTLTLIAAALSQLFVFLNGDLIEVAAALLACVCYGAGAVVAFRMIRGLLRRTPSAELAFEALVFMPLGLLAAGAMSSGGDYKLYEAIGILVLIAPVIFPGLFRWRSMRPVYVQLALALALSGLVFKCLVPASWHSYRAPPVFARRHVLNHPVYGSMIIDPRLQEFFGGMCRTIGPDRNVSVLSLPFPYVNYYCSIPPWRNYIQTFFDLSGRDVIDSLMADINRTPPDWILYQRQLYYLAMHERTFNGGRRLPHRDLDDLIMNKIAAGEWKVVMKERYGLESDWFLIDTRPAAKFETRVKL